MTNEQQALVNRFTDYLAAESTPEERTAVDALLARSPEAATLFHELRSTWNCVPALLSPGDAESTERVAREVHRVIRDRAERPALRTVARDGVAVHGRRWMRWLGAGVLASVIGATVVATGVLHPGGSENVASRAYSTTVGQRAVVTLRDGSRVTLAPQTTLRLDAGFGRTTRGMALSGEARFDVADATRVPFVVRTGAIETRVLGTAFTVRRYPGDAAAHVAVARGKVGVSANTPRRPSITLTAGGVGVVSDSTAVVETIGATSPYSAWVGDQLVFRKAPVPEVLATLTRWYGYQFHLADPELARKNLTLGLSTSSSREALATLKLTLNVDLSFAGTVVTLAPRRATKDPAPRARDLRNFISPRIREVGR